MKKKVFLTFKEASEYLQMNTTYLYKFFKRGKPYYQRKTDGKLFLIYEDKEKLCSIDGKEYNSFGEIKKDFEITPTYFLNQLAKKKNNFLDKK